MYKVDAVYARASGFYFEMSVGGAIPRCSTDRPKGAVVCTFVAEENWFKGSHKQDAYKLTLFSWLNINNNKHDLTNSRSLVELYGAT